MSTTISGRYRDKWKFCKNIFGNRLELRLLVMTLLKMMFLPLLKSEKFKLYPPSKRNSFYQHFPQEFIRTTSSSSSRLFKVSIVSSISSKHKTPQIRSLPMQVWTQFACHTIWNVTETFRRPDSLVMRRHYLLKYIHSVVTCSYTKLFFVSVGIDTDFKQCK